MENTDVETVNTKWSNIKNTVFTIGKRELKQEHKKKNWMTEEILELTKKETLK